jgi:hypothetical protein
VAPVPSEPPAVATQPVPPAQVASRDRLGATASSLLVDPTLSALELLPADLTAGDARYNTREVMLRERLSLPAVESRLREAARQSGVEFDRSDLEGVLRNAGYDAAHLGSTERYMAAIEKFVGEAENSYRQRTGNMPGSRA